MMHTSDSRWTKKQPDGYHAAATNKIKENLKH